MGTMETSQRRALIVAALLAVPVLGIAVYIANKPPQELPQAENDLTLNGRGTEREVGGVPRPASDVAPATPARSNSARDQAIALVGTTPTISPDANESAKSVDQAIRDKEHPGRLSPMMQPEPFDEESYRKDPKSYLAIHEPARVWDTAQPGEGVPVLQAVSGKRHAMRQGESVRLSVKTSPNMPVTFTSFDLGLFDNGLTSISVAADDQGIAKAAFHASPGTVGEVNILAGSPAAAEHIRFAVFIQQPTATNQATGSP